MIAIQTRDLQKHYGSVHALDGLTLAVQAGTIFGFLGPNGAGKSTAIRLLTGLSHPTGGQAWVVGKEININHNVAGRIGYLPEEPAFYGWMTPIEFLDYVASLFGMRAAERKQRVAELLDQVGLKDAGKRRIAGFSRGMRQRLGLAQALINRPEVLFLDEPVSALDPVGRKEVLEMIGKLSGQFTVFMSTHILADVERICDTIGIINHGKLVVEAPQAELLARYTVPAFELECQPGDEARLAALAQSLIAVNWVSSAMVQDNMVRVLVKDVSVARQGLLPLVAQAGMPLRRYEQVVPSLEDIFLQVVNGKDGVA
ncbi:MAG: ABC transporter ATP-binding protein [Anaerolineaceae bacterium]|jgi:ABC-2 type transport system ATP-binding protein